MARVTLLAVALAAFCVHAAQSQSCSTDADCASQSAAGIRNSFLYCKGGTCVAGCVSPSLTFCMLSNSLPDCAAFTNDTTHCGGCWRTCYGGGTCDNGICSSGLVFSKIYPTPGGTAVSTLPPPTLTSYTYGSIDNCPNSTPLQYVKASTDGKYVWSYAGPDGVIRFECSGCKNEGTSTMWDANLNQCVSLGAATSTALAQPAASSMSPTSTALPTTVLAASSATASMASLASSAGAASTSASTSGLPSAAASASPSAAKSNGKRMLSWVGIAGSFAACAALFVLHGVVL